MNTTELIVDRIRHSAAEVFSTMLGVELAFGEATVETGNPAVNDGVMALIGLAGTWVGTGCLSCSPALACRICSLMLMTEIPAINEEVLDAVAELTNMIVGGAKNDLEIHLGPMGLSIPTVVYGRNFQARSARSTEWTVVRFPWEGESLTVKLFLAPAEKVAQNSAYMSHQCALDV